MNDKLKLTILVNDKPVYFGAPVFYSQKVDGDGVTLSIKTEIGTTTKQTVEIQIKNPTYVDFTPTTGDAPQRADG